MLFSYILFRMGRLPYENKMFAKGTKQEDTQRPATVGKFHAYEIKGQRVQDTKSAYEIFWINSVSLRGRRDRNSQLFYCGSILIGSWSSIQTRSQAQRPWQHTQSRPSVPDSTRSPQAVIQLGIGTDWKGRWNVNDFRVRSQRFDDERTASFSLGNQRRLRESAKQTLWLLDSTTVTRILHSPAQFDFHIFILGVK